jgi:hypothetical protein
MKVDPFAELAFLLVLMLQFCNSSLMWINAINQDEFFFISILLIGASHIIVRRSWKKEKKGKGKYEK